VGRGAGRTAEGEALHLQETITESVPEEGKQEQERLQQKRSRILKQHREGHIDDLEFEREMAAVLLSLRLLEAGDCIMMWRTERSSPSPHVLFLPHFFVTSKVLGNTKKLPERSSRFGSDYGTDGMQFIENYISGTRR
jgi:hypothetical protein